MNAYTRSTPFPGAELETVMLEPLQHSQAGVVPDSDPLFPRRSSQDHLLRPSPGEDLPPTSLDVQHGAQRHGADSAEPGVGKPRPESPRSVLKDWAWEATVMLTAVATLVALIVLLKQYDGVQQPDWPSWINLSTVVSILSTALRASLALVIASVIGNEKWIWLDKTRPLRHVEVFDDASRGSWGSFILLLKTPRAYAAALGAILTVLSLATGSFMQQTLKTSVCQTPARNSSGSLMTGSVAAAFRSPATADLLQCGNRLMCPAPGLRAAIAGGLTNPGSIASTVLFDCPTGNCTFPEHNGITYSSIGYCSSCEDITDTIQEGPRPGGSDFNDTQAEIDQGYDHFVMTSDANVTISYGEVRDTWLTVHPAEDEWWSTNFTVLSFTRAGCQETNDTEFGPGVDCSISNPKQHKSNPFLPSDLNMVAASCSVKPCLYNYNGSIHNGKLEETVVSRVLANGSNGRWSHNTAGRPPINIPVAQSPCLVDGAWYDMANFTAVPRLPERNFTSIWQDGVYADVPWECTYLLLFTYPGALLEFFKAALNGSCGTGDYTSELTQQAMCPEDAWMLAPLYNDGQATVASVGAVLDGMVSAITNRLRNTGTSAYDPEHAFGSYSATGPALVNGQAWETTVCTHVQWPWVALPAALTAATAVLLGAVMGRSWRDRASRPVWKSSILPLIFHGPRGGRVEEAGESTVVSTTLDDMRRLADGMQVKLGKGEVDLVLVGLQEEKPSSLRSPWRGRGSSMQSRLDVDSLYGS